MKRPTVFRDRLKMRNRPIGIFDSGIGGLTVLKEIKKILPAEDIVYFGDTARVPYGAKSKETVIRFSLENADFLAGKNVKMIVVACNTSSSYSLPALKRRHDVPVVGVIKPGAREAAGVTRNLKIGVIGTKATIASCIYDKEIKRINPGIDVVTASCPLFVPLVEEGWLMTDVTRIAAGMYLDPLRRKNIDAIVLGCTHYPLLKPVIRRVLGPDVAIIDSAVQTAKAVKGILYEKDIYKKGGRGRLKFYVSDEPGLFEDVGSRFLGCKITGVKRTEAG